MADDWYATFGHASAKSWLPLWDFWSLSWGLCNQYPAALGTDRPNVPGQFLKALFFLWVLGIKCGASDMIVKCTKLCPQIPFYMHVCIFMYVYTYV